jgi:hypothetical protein
MHPASAFSTAHDLLSLDQIPHGREYIVAAVTSAEPVRCASVRVDFVMLACTGSTQDTVDPAGHLRLHHPG